MASIRNYGRWNDYKAAAIRIIGMDDPAILDEYVEERLADWERRNPCLADDD
jgi:hypothetical protein